MSDTWNAYQDPFPNPGQRWCENAAGSREETVTFQLTFNTGAASPALPLAGNRSFLTHHGEEPGRALISPIHAFQINQLPAILLSFLI